MTDERTVPIDPRGGFELPTRVIHVEVVEGPDRGLVARLPGPQARVGTGEECQLVLTDRTVSRCHMSVHVEGEKIRVRDAGSRNGTSIDGMAIVEAYARPDSQIRIGSSTLQLHMLDEMVALAASPRESFGALLGRSAAMRQVFSLLERISPTESTVLVQGESGTGKELVAAAIHEHSRPERARGPFVLVDCGAVAGQLLESELFGHVKGAFTGAISDRRGMFEEADGGTLFLDEIGELPLDLQPKLLGALERRQVRRVGAPAGSWRKVDVRIIAATKRVLPQDVERGTFRDDLYYRLAALTVTLPPLRERPEDIPLLVRHFERDLAPSLGAPLPLSEERVRDLAARVWRGNIRELKNAVARALTLGDNRVSAVAEQSAPLPDALAVDLAEPLKAGLDRVSAAFERAYIEAMLQKTGANVSRAAELAQVSRRHMQRRMALYGLRGSEGEEGEPEDIE